MYLQYSFWCGFSIPLIFKCVKFCSNIDEEGVHLNVFFFFLDLPSLCHCFTFLTIKRNKPILLDIPEIEEELVDGTIADDFDIEDDLEEVEEVIISMVSKSVKYAFIVLGLHF